MNSQYTSPVSWPRAVFTRYCVSPKTLSLYTFSWLALGPEPGVRHTQVNAGECGGHCVMAGRGPGNTLQYLPPQGKLGLLPSHVTGELVSQRTGRASLRQAGLGQASVHVLPGGPVIGEWQGHFLRSLSWCWHGEKRPQETALKREEV